MEKYKLNFSDLDEFNALVLSEEISISDAWIIIKSSKKRLYGTKFWLDKRKALIKEKCENCGSSEKLTLQHTQQPELPEFRRCLALSKQNKEVASRLQFTGYIESFKKYIQCIHTKTLCNKCAYAEDFKGSTRMFCETHNDWYYSYYGCKKCKNESWEKHVISENKVFDLVYKTYKLNDEVLVETAKSLSEEESYWYVVWMYKKHKRLIPAFEHIIRCGNSPAFVSESHEKNIITKNKIFDLLDKTYKLNDEVLVETAKSLSGLESTWYVVWMWLEYHRLIPSFENIIDRFKALDLSKQTSISEWLKQHRPSFENIIQR